MRPLMPKPKPAHRPSTLFLLAALALSGAAPAGDGGRWALEPLRDVSPPGIENTAWPRGSVDRFVLSRFEARELAPSPMADPRTLVRRLYYDLIGLPPSPERIARFVADPTDERYAALVDELLASPAHGERWARHWLDVVRYGESDGFEYNSPRKNAWHYRDWVIRALNADMPYDRFVRMQLAGDILEPGYDGASAVGFLVAGVHNTVVSGNPRRQAMARQDELEEIVGTVGQTFLGLTIQCARCHDHKFDPVSVAEYYRVATSLDGAWHGERDVARSDGAKARVHMVIARNPAPMRIHERGDVTRLGDEVRPGGLAAIQGPKAEFGIAGKSTDAERRVALARWITDASNAPFARTIVNRVWHYHFGTGIVDTPSDLGVNGGRPSHPELLDWLARRLLASGWRLKSLHREIVLSATYRQSSRIRPDAHAEDATNRLLWRYPPRRVEAEVLRDSILLVCGALNSARGGPGFEDVEIRQAPPTHYFVPVDRVGEEFDRRTIYRFSPRGGRPTVLDTFDCPDPSTTAPRRSVTTTPLQSLSLWNSAFVLRMSERFAERVKRESSDDADAWTRHAWQLAIGRDPDEEERVAATHLVSEHGLASLARVLFNSGEFVVIE